MHKSYLMDQNLTREIQKIIENMFVIKILNKAKEGSVTLHKPLKIIIKIK